VPTPDIPSPPAMSQQSSGPELSSGDQSPRTHKPPFWLNGALTGVVLTSVLVAALDHAGLKLNPVEDVAWILILLLCTSLVRAYAAFVAGRATDQTEGSRTASILRNEWPLLAAGVPAVLILLTALHARWPTITAVRTVLFIDVAILLALGVAGARTAGYRLRWAILFGIADAVLGALVIIANIFLR
jgi:hypothetical protein